MAEAAEKKYAVMLNTNKDWRRWFNYIKAAAGDEWRHSSPEDDYVPEPNLAAPEVPVIELRPPLNLQEGKSAEQLKEAERIYHLEAARIDQNNRALNHRYTYALQRHNQIKQANKDLGDLINNTVSDYIRDQICGFTNARERLVFVYGEYKEVRSEARTDATKTYEELLSNFTPTESWIGRWEKAVAEGLRLKVAVTEEGKWLEDLAYTLHPLNQLVANEGHREYKVGGKMHEEKNVNKWAQELRHLRNPNAAKKGIARPQAFSATLNQIDTPAGSAGPPESGHPKRALDENNNGDQNPAKRRQKGNFRRGR
ncbi:hypothetical protein SEPCBS119000_002986 [Sporothrix epigloea]|uniref:Gag protein n=1 Tax=Sporothrix epigloea TaxID=1892477 RepID=A0ABP0DJ51_9PEZI